MVLIAISDSAELISHKLRAQFDHEVKCSAPASSERCELLAYLAKDHISKQDAHDVGAIAHGLSHADIAQAVRSACAEIVLAENPTSEQKRDAFARALAATRPSIVADLQVAVPAVSWSDVGGLHAAKRELQQCVQTFSENARRLGAVPDSAVLLYGPPGTGKTMLGKALAASASFNFLPIDVSTFVRSEVGESEKAIADAFRRARLAAPCVLFFDEFQAVFGARSGSTSNVRFFSWFVDFLTSSSLFRFFSSR